MKIFRNIFLALTLLVGLPGTGVIAPVMAAQVLLNNTYTKLVTAVAPSDVTINVTPGDGAKFALATGGNTIRATLVKISGFREIAWEIVDITARSTDTLTITRAREGTTALTFSIGDVIDVRFTAGMTPGAIGAALLAGSSSQNFAANALTGASTVSGLVVSGSKNDQTGWGSASILTRSTSGDVYVGFAADGSSAAAIRHLRGGAGVEIVNASSNPAPLKTSDLTVVGSTSGAIYTNATGQLYGSALHNNAGAVTGTTNQYIASGTYTPTLTNAFNVSSSTAYASQWIRVGNVTTVSGKVTINATAASFFTLGMSLPIASNLTASEQCAGTFNTTGATYGGAVNGDATNDRAFFNATPNASGATDYFFTFTYLIL